MLRSLISLLLLANLNLGGVEIEQSASADKPAMLKRFDMINLLEVNPVPVKSYEDIAPVVEAKAVLVMDLDSGVLLYEKNSHEPLPMASLTKIMTAVLILENHGMNEVVEVHGDFRDLDGVRIWLRINERITVGDLLIGLLVRSAGDAAIAFANYHSGSVDEFVAEMNEKAKILNLKNTRFQNTIGLDQEDHYSSAYDLAILTKYALHFSDFRRIVKLDKATIKSVDGKIEHSFDSTNYLLNSYLDIYGVKTGTTEAAGQSLINLARNSNGNEIISVLLNSPSRFQENKSIIDWVFRTYKW